ncbi:MAG TPA: hypothetical protein VGP07_13320 [Polyangia bacterium]|jgi:glutathione S-transferase
MMRFVTLDEARAARGLRLVVMANGPSPWTEAAKGCFDVKGLDYLAVRLTPSDTETRAWTGAHNAPVALFEDEPARAGWAEILALAERLAPQPSLIPGRAADRIEMFGLAHEILGEGALVWSLRLQQIHAGLVTNGGRGFSVPAARYLAAKYGYAPERVAPARERLGQVLDALGARLADGRRYLLGTLTALDIYAAVAMGVFAPLPEEQCPMAPPFRQAFSTLDDELRAAVPAALLAHRDFIYDRHLVLPVRF